MKPPGALRGSRAAIACGRTRRMAAGGRRGIDGAPDHEKCSAHRALGQKAESPKRTNEVQTQERRQTRASQMPPRGAWEESAGATVPAQQLSHAAAPTASQPRLACSVASCAWLLTPCTTTVLCASPYRQVCLVRAQQRLQEVPEMAAALQARTALWNSVELRHLAATAQFDKASVESRRQEPPSWSAAACRSPRLGQLRASPKRAATHVARRPALALTAKPPQHAPLASSGRRAGSLRKPRQHDDAFLHSATAALHRRARSLATVA